MYLALRKCKNDFKILKIILVQEFCPLNLILLDFLSDFVLVWAWFHDTQLKSAQ